MKKLSILLISLAVLSCNNAPKTDTDTKVGDASSQWKVKADSIHQETMDLHDEAMMLMEPIVELMDSVRSREDIDSALSASHLTKLEDSETAMMDWMHHGHGADTLKGEERFKAMSDRWASMNEVNNQMKESIDAAEKILTSE